MRPVGLVAADKSRAAMEFSFVWRRLRPNSSGTALASATRQQMRLSLTFIVGVGLLASSNTSVSAQHANATPRALGAVENHQPAPAATTAQASALSEYLRLPLRFEANRGQTDPR